MWISTGRRLIVIAVLVFCRQAWCGTVSLDFDGFPDSTPLTTQYPGLLFTNATILTAGIGLNELEFPPRSGGNVIFDDGGPIVINFSEPALNFGAYFTYTVPIVLTAFDGSSTPVASAVSAFSSNLALSGDPGSAANEFLSVNYSGGISTLTIAGAASGGSFVMDSAISTPEPSSVISTSAALVILLMHKYMRPLTIRFLIAGFVVVCLSTFGVFAYMQRADQGALDSLRVTLYHYGNAARTTSQEGPNDGGTFFQLVRYTEGYLEMAPSSDHLTVPDIASALATQRAKSPKAAEIIFPTVQTVHLADKSSVRFDRLFINLVPARVEPYSAVVYLGIGQYSSTAFRSTSTATTFDTLIPDLVR